MTPIKDELMFIQAMVDPELKLRSSVKELRDSKEFIANLSNLNVCL